MDSRLERAAAFVLREADAYRSISFDELKDYHLVPVAVMAELRAALAARPAQAGEGEWVWSRENDDDAWAIVHRRGPNRPEKITVAAYDAQRVCLLLNAAAAPSRPGGAA